MSAISDKLIERLTLYHGILTHTVPKVDYIASSEIANLLHIDDSQVRKDVAFCGVLGRPKYGYATKELKKAIEDKLAFRETKDVFIIGAGHLGTALTRYADFRDYGINVLALFDTDKEKINQTINGKKVYSMACFNDLVKENKVDTAILTVPPQEAQKVTDYLVKGGIKFIWNFTPCILRVPADVIVHYENMISGFLKMRREGG